MPRPARRKREKELAETAKRMRKLTSFFSSVPTKEVVEPDIDSGSNSTLPSTTESPPTCLSHHSDSESNFSDRSADQAIYSHSFWQPSVFAKFYNYHPICRTYAIANWINRMFTRTGLSAFVLYRQKALQSYQEEIKRTSITKVTELWNRIKNLYIGHSHKHPRLHPHIFAHLQF